MADCARAANWFTAADCVPGIFLCEIHGPRPVKNVGRYMGRIDTV